MYEQFYGLVESPFSFTPDPKFFYPGASHLLAYEQLRYGIHQGECFMVVYGDKGTGKTTLCRTVLESLPDTVYTALLLNPFISEIELLRAILRNFGVISQDGPESDKPVSKDDLLASLNMFLTSIMQLGGRGLILIDEAQNIPVRTLEQIRILSNLETNKQKLLQIVLVGQSELKKTLDRPDLRQLSQRISFRCELSPLTRDEAAAYITHRLTMASSGPPKAVFTSGALRIIYNYCNGNPRLINLVGDRCLTAGLVSKTTEITGRIAKEAVTNLALPKIRKLMIWPVQIAILLTVGLLLVLLWLWATAGAHLP